VKATITIEDVPDNQVTMKVEFDPPIDDATAASHACTIALEMMQSAVKNRHTTIEESDGE
jgi:hypothetical protein